MKASRAHTWTFALFCVALAGFLVSGPIAASPQGQGKKKSSESGSASTPTTYSGRATVVSAIVLGVGTTVCDTGELPESGGSLDASANSTSVAGLVSGDACHATCVGQGHYSRSEASIGSLTLTVGCNTISAAFCMARANATCDDDGNADASGCSEVSALSVNGNDIQISGAVNQQNVSFQGLTITINEQVKVVDGNCAEITVKALHVVAVNALCVTVADISVCTAHADICCGETQAEVKDWVTGGGFITGTPSGAHGNFGVAGGIKNGSFWGHLNYIDHGTGMHVRHVTITGYDATGPTERRITGTCTIDGQGGYTFSCFVADNGEPGTNDTFNLFLSSGYSAGGYLQGGNIQLHH
jgi:hypothetical protein